MVWKMRQTHDKFKFRAVVHCVEKGTLLRATMLSQYVDECHQSKEPCEKMSEMMRYFKPCDFAGSASRVDSAPIPKEDIHRKMACITVQHIPGHVNRVLPSASNIKRLCGPANNSNCTKSDEYRCLRAKSTNCPPQKHTATTIIEVSANSPRHPT